MSKVEVKKGDRWTHCSGVLAQIRTEKDGRVAARFIYPNGVKPWIPYENHEASSRHCASNEFDAARAPMWLQGMGYTVVEEREEEKAAELTLHVYYLPASGQVLMFKEQAVGMPVGRYLGTTTIHIAGVTT